MNCRLLASGQDDPEWTLEKEMATKRGVAYKAPEARARVDDEDHQQQEAVAISEGDRCEVTPGGKRGTVRSPPCTRSHHPILAHGRTLFRPSRRALPTC